MQARAMPAQIDPGLYQWLDDRRGSGQRRAPGGRRLPPSRTRNIIDCNLQLFLLHSRHSQTQRTRPFPHSTTPATRRSPRPARGAFLEDAYEDAGFAAGLGHASRLALTPCIAECIAELRAQKVDLDEARTHALIAGLLRIAKAGEDLASAAALKEARLTLLEVERLRSDMDRSRALERFDIRSPSSFLNSTY
jgi:hypothetical protein